MASSWKKLCEYQEQHGVQVVFCDNKINAQEKAMFIFDEVTEILLREDSEDHIKAISDAWLNINVDDSKIINPFSVPTEEEFTTKLTCHD